MASRVHFPSPGTASRADAGADAPERPPSRRRVPRAVPPQTRVWRPASGGGFHEVSHRPLGARRPLSTGLPSASATGPGELRYSRATGPGSGRARAPQIPPLGAQGAARRASLLQLSASGFQTPKSPLLTIHLPLVSLALRTRPGHAGPYYCPSSEPQWRVTQHANGAGSDNASWGTAPGSETAPGPACPGRLWLRWK